METHPSRLAAALVIALAACGGSSADKDAFNQRKALCQSLLATPSTPALTPIDVSSQFAAQATTKVFPAPILRAFVPGDCFNNLLPVSSPPDTCSYPADGSVTICSTFFEWIAGDQDLCNNGNCVYYCEVRWQENLGTVRSDGLSDAPVCAVRFVSGQPSL